MWDLVLLCVCVSVSSKLKKIWATVSGSAQSYVKENLRRRVNKRATSHPLYSALALFITISSQSRNQVKDYQLLKRLSLLFRWMSFHISRCTISAFCRHRLPPCSNWHACCHENYLKYFPGKQFSHFLFHSSLSGAAFQMAGWCHAAVWWLLACTDVSPWLAMPGCIINFRPVRLIRRSSEEGTGHRAFISRFLRQAELMDGLKMLVERCSFNLSLTLCPPPANWSLFALDTHSQRTLLTQYAA